MSANYVLLSEQTLNASAASVTFASIPQTGYTDLKVVVSSRVSSTDTPISVSFNGSSANFSWRRIYGSGSSASSQSGTNSYWFYTDTAAQTANTFGSGEFYIPNYTGATNKSVSSESLTENNATTAEMFIVAALWSQTAAITSIGLTPLTGSFIAGSTFSLYGIAALGTTPTVVPHASGGDVITNDGTYWIHQFLSSGTFIPNKALTCDYLVVAGGGGGGSSDSSSGAGGGGGAGGKRDITSQTLLSTGYTVTVGGGGVSNTNGTNSSFNSSSATGGGRGASSGANGTAGGSGGGAGRVSSTTTGGAGNAGGYTPVEGYKGGDATANSLGAGGGGSGSAGVNATVAGTGTNGGNGSTSTITSLTYAGGGGGGSYTGYPASSGQAGGGAGGVGSANGSNATINTGSGGGGAGGQVTSGFSGGAGGSGIVIVRYLMV